MFNDDGVLTHVKVLHAGERQNFWPSLITRGKKEGWLEQTESSFVIKDGKDGVTYTVMHSPGEVVDGKIINVYQCQKSTSWLGHLAKKGKRAWQILSTT